MPNWLIVIIYIFLMYLANFVIGPYLHTKYINHRHNPFGNTDPKAIEFGQFYLKFALYIVVPFRTLTRESKHYIVRLLGASVNLIYGGFGIILLIAATIALAIIDTVLTIFDKIREI